jgi:hypothetical protein
MPSRKTFEFGAPGNDSIAQVKISSASAHDKEGVAPSFDPTALRVSVTSDGTNYYANPLSVADLARMLPPETVEQIAEQQRYMAVENVPHDDDTHSGQ